MLDQLVIDETGSLDEFDASVKERKIGSPKKKIIKETVPFSNVTYDFSKINGELYWEERELEYVFEIVAGSAEELEEKKQPFIAWIMNVMEARIYDPYIPDYYFAGTFADLSCDDSEIEKSTITVKFTVYPYMIANTETVRSYSIEEGEEKTVVIKNGSSHRITPILITDVPVSITFGNSTFWHGGGEIKNTKLEVGQNIFKVKSTSGNGLFQVRFFEEVF